MNSSFSISFGRCTAQRVINFINENKEIRGAFANVTRENTLICQPKKKRKERRKKKERKNS